VERRRASTEKSRSWDLISAGIVSRDAGEVTWRSNHHRVTVSLAVVQGTARIEDGAAQSFRFAPGDFSFTPAGVSTRAIQPAGRLLQTVQSLATYDDIISEIVRGGSIQLEQRHPINDPTRLFHRSYRPLFAKPRANFSTMCSLTR